MTIKVTILNILMLMETEYTLFTDKDVTSMQSFLLNRYKSYNKQLVLDEVIELVKEHSCFDESLKRNFCKVVIDNFTRQ